MDLLQCALLAMDNADPQTTIASFNLMLGTRTVSLWSSLDISDGPAIHIITPEEY